MIAIKHTDERFVRLSNKILKAFLPRKRYNLSDWAEKTIKVPKNTAHSGRWSRKTAPYQAAIMDAISDPAVCSVAVMSSTQVGKTLMMEMAVGYFMEQKPTPMLAVFPNIGVANTFIKTKLQPFVEENEKLIKLTGKLSGSHTQNSARLINFPRGFLATAGTNSASDLAMHSIGLLIGDETDRFEQDVGDEGRPQDIARKRGDSYGSRFKELYFSTPVNLQTSFINDEYMEGTQERWGVVCPSCEEDHFFSLEAFNAEDATMSCAHCGAVHDEYAWKKQPGKFVAQNPDAFNHDRVKRSFHLNAWISPFVSWKKIADDYLKSLTSSKSKQKTFRNTTEGLPWDDSLEKVDREGLEKRLEQYEADCPMGVRFLTAGVDVQPDRVEINVMGWGLGFENWSVDYHIIPGKPESPETWREVTRRLNKKYTHACGMKMNIARTFIDAGFQQATVMRFANGAKKVYPIKGQGGEHRPFMLDFKKYQKKQKPRDKPFMLGVDEGKSYAYAYLNVQEEGLGYCHFKEGLNTKEFFAQLTAEARVEKKDKKGNMRYEWVKKRDRNEALDTFVYALAAAESMDPDWQKLERQIEAWQESHKKQVEALSPEETPVKKEAARPQVNKAVKPRRSKRKLVVTSQRS